MSSPTHFTGAFTHKDLPTMQYSTVLAITAQSAVSTLLILDRQGRKDARKVWTFLTSPAAIATYRSLWQLLQILCLIAVACGASVRAWVDSTVAEAQIPVAEPVNRSQIPDPWELPLEQPEQPQEPVVLALSAPVQPVALLPAARSVEPAWKSLKGEAKKTALRKACTEKGIQWRRKVGKAWKMLTIAQMEAALSS